MTALAASVSILACDDSFCKRQRSTKRQSKNDIYCICNVTRAFLAARFFARSASSSVVSTFFVWFRDTDVQMQNRTKIKTTYVVAVFFQLLHERKKQRLSFWTIETKIVLVLLAAFRKLPAAYSIKEKSKNKVDRNSQNNDTSLRGDFGCGGAAGGWEAAAVVGVSGVASFA